MRLLAALVLVALPGCAAIRASLGIPPAPGEVPGDGGIVDTILASGEVIAAAFVPAAAVGIGALRAAMRASRTAQATREAMEGPSRSHEEVCALTARVERLEAGCAAAPTPGVVG